jgi:hypothetical protein
MRKRDTNSPITVDEDVSRDSSTLKYDTINQSSTSLRRSPEIPLTFSQRLSLFWHIHNNYFLGLLYRIVTLIVIIGVLIAIGIGLKYTDDMPKPEDFSHLDFNWKINPGDYLTPYNTSFGYNVLLNGHAHSTYSDGKMNVRQLLEWHLGKIFLCYYFFLQKI